jgi:hypothetical protein
MGTEESYEELFMAGTLPLQGQSVESLVVKDTPPSTQQSIDAALVTLQAQKNAWVSVGVRQRVGLIDELIKNLGAVAQSWVTLCLEAKGLAPDTPAAVDEWLGGPYLILKFLRQLRQSLIDIDRYGRPRIPGAVKTRPDGQVVVQVFPQKFYDRLFYGGITAEVWMEPQVTLAQLPQTQALAYQNQEHPGKVALVLGAGNVSCLGPTDLLYKLFVEDQVVILKTHPVNAYLGPLIEESFRPLIDRGFLQVVSGGASEGKYLCYHPQVDEIHLTGAAATFEAIIFGPGPEGARRKAERKPLLTKRITGELGNVSPVIVVPGPWNSRQLEYHATNLASMLVTNAGFNCLTTRVIIQHKDWELRHDLLDRTRQILANIPPRKAYYPGAEARYLAFMAKHPEAEQFGSPPDGTLPWTLIPDLDPWNDAEICYRTEAFCSIFSETAIEASSVPEFIDRAVAFANSNLWGTLSATLIVHPDTLADPTTASAVDRALANLRYGTIAINHWAAVGYGLVASSWGGYPGQDIYDIQSGLGVVHNTLMFSRPQKSIIQGRFTDKLTPLWFVTHRTAHEVGRKLTSFETSPSLWRLPGLIWSAVRGSFRF